MSERSMSILDALRAPDVFGTLPALADLGTWRSWEVFLAALYGLPLDDADLKVFRKHTGLRRPRQGGYPEAAVIVGRQSGKTRIAGLVAAYEAGRAVVAGGRNVYAAMVAQDLRGAQRALFAYAKEAVECSELLRPEVTRETNTELELGGTVTLGTYPCRPAALRGIRASVVVVDELAHFVATDGRPTDTEMLRAVRPMLATTGGKLLILSSPYSASGALYDLHKKHWGREDSETLIWQATAPEMNPTLPEDYLRRMEQEDPEAYRSEVLGEFRAGVSTFIDPDALDAVIDDGTRERAPDPNFYYAGYADAASGSGKDSFALAIAHRVEGVAVLDVCRAWGPPFNPSGVIAEAADLLRRFGLTTVSGDRYAPGLISEHFRKAGIHYEGSRRSTSDTYLELLPLVNAGEVVLLDHPKLLKELRSLERRRGTAGRDKVDHRRGAHDDRAVAAAGALVAASEDRSDEPWLLNGRSSGPSDAHLAEIQARIDKLKLELGLRE